MEIYRYCIKLGQYTHYVSSYKALDKKYFLNQFKIMIELKKPFYTGEVIDFERFSTEVVKIEPHDCVVNKARRLVLDQKLLRIKAVAEYPEIEKLEGVYRYIKKLNKGDIISDHQNIRDAIGIDKKEYFNQINQLIEVDIFDTLYKLRDTDMDWTEDLMSLRKVHNIGGVEIDGTDPFNILMGLLILVEVSKED